MSVKLIINMMSFSDHREHKITQKQWQQRGGGGGGVNCEDRGLGRMGRGHEEMKGGEGWRKMTVLTEAETKVCYTRVRCCDRK